jgi:F-type H+-transporting ATPase subunit a
MLNIVLAASDFNPVSEFTDFVHHPYIDLPGKLDINKAVIYLWMASALSIVLVLAVTRRGLKNRPDKPQTAIEAIYDVCLNQIARAGLPEEGLRIWFPYIATLFVFIWMNNLIGFIPLPFGDDRVYIPGTSLTVPKLQIYAATANFSVAITLTLITFFATHVEGIRYNGVLPYFKSWMPSGMPKITSWKNAVPIGLLVGLIGFIEVLSQLVRLVSLSFRLFFNLLAGHLVIAVFLSIGALLGGVSFYFIQPIGVGMGVALYALEATLIAVLQAFIFASLSAIYIGGAIHPDH